MFLVDKYYNDSNYITCHQTIIDKIIDSFDAHNQIYSNVNSIIKMSNDEFKKVIDDLEYGTWRYSNFQHLIVYGPVGSGKEYLINKLLEKLKPLLTVIFKPESSAKYPLLIHNIFLVVL